MKLKNKIKAETSLKGGLRTKGIKKKNNPEQPLVSIITVIYNNPVFLEKTIQSVLNQSYSNIEYIIIDGGSTDGATIDIIKKYENFIDYWISEPDNGIYDAMNKGIRYSSDSAYLNFLNAGDQLVDNNTLANLFKNIIVDRPDIIYGDIEYIDPVLNNTFYQKALPFNLANLLKQGTRVVCHQAIFVKKEIVPEYDIRYRFKGELNWYFDLVEKKDIKIVYNNIPVIIYHMGGFGYKYFLRNRLEWVAVVIRRYGFMAIYENKLISFLYRNSLHRYPFLKKIDAFFSNK